MTDNQRIVNRSKLKIERWSCGSWVRASGQALQTASSSAGDGICSFTPVQCTAAWAWQRLQLCDTPGEYASSRDDGRTESTSILYRLQKQRTKYDLRNHFLLIQIVNVWNRVFPAL